jgi:hypothetical protein
LIKESPQRAAARLKGEILGGGQEKKLYSKSLVKQLLQHWKEFFTLSLYCVLACSKQARCTDRQRAAMANSSN